MNVCLIFPPTFMLLKPQNTYLPLGITVLREVLEKSEHNVNIFPTSALCTSVIASVDRIENEGFAGIDEFKDVIQKCDVLGLSCDSFNYSIAKIIAQDARHINGNIKIIVGGIHASLADEWIAKNNNIDIVIRGEGERSIVEVMEYFEGKRDINSICGITYKNLHGKIISTPNRELLTREEILLYSMPSFKESELEHYKLLPIETSRGCPYSCSFCSVLNKRKWRNIPSEYIVEQINRVSKLTSKIIFVDDAFTIDEDRAIKILSYINSLEKDIQIEFEARANNLSKSNILAAIDNRKILKFQIGAECGYNEGLNKIGKNLTIEDIEASCKKAYDTNVSEKMLASFIVGFPWETPKECIKTIDFAVNLRKTYGIRIVTNWWLPVPSRLWYYFKKKGFADESMFDDPDWITSSFELFHPNISKQDKAKINFLMYAQN